MICCNAIVNRSVNVIVLEIYKNITFILTLNSLNFYIYFCSTPKLITISTERHWDMVVFFIRMMSEKLFHTIR